MRYRVEYVRDVQEDAVICHSRDVSDALDKAARLAWEEYSDARALFSAEGFQIRDLNKGAIVMRHPRPVE